jgi:hypothetical protein
LKNETTSTIDDVKRINWHHFENALRTRNRNFSAEKREEEKETA